jgi:hypothetical protein
MALPLGVIDAIEVLDEARLTLDRVRSPGELDAAQLAVADAEKRLRVAFDAAAARGWRADG